MKKYLVEFIGTFFFVLTIVVVVNVGPAGFAPLAIGTVLMVMVYAGGHISGAHYNPAVTLGVFIRGKLPASEIFPYWISQIVGGVLAALVGVYLVGEVDASKVPSNPESLKVVPSLIAEFLGTFALVYVVLNTATAKGTANNSFYGLAIGFTVMCMAYSLGAVSGGAFNPAIATGVVAAKMSAFSSIWIPYVANLAAGVVAAIVFNFVNDDND